VINCPKCGADITESYQDYDPSVGIMGAGWFCDTCDVFVDDDRDGSDDGYNEREKS
jgi:hypothetical protein